MARRYNAAGVDFDTSDVAVAAGIGTGDFTWAFWFYSDAIATGAHAAVGNGARAPALYMMESGVTANLSLYWGGFNTFTAATSYSSTWIHYALVRSGGTVTLYVDGVADATTHAIGTSWTDSRLTLGGADTAGLDGLPDESWLAEHALWNRALSAGEVVSLAAKFSPLFHARGLVSYSPLYQGDLVQDYVAGGTWTESGTVEGGPGPGIIRPVMQQAFQLRAVQSIIYASVPLTAGFNAQANTLRGTSPFVWLFEVEVPTVPATRFRFTSHTQPVSFGTNANLDPIEYQPFPVKMGTVQESKSGDLPEINVTVANVGREVGAQLEAYRGLVGQPVVIRLVNLATLLDPNAQIRQDSTVRMVTVRHDTASFRLSPYNLYQEKIPSHRYLKNFCPFLFGGVRCGYQIPSSTNETVGGGFSKCPKTFSACIERGEDEVARGLVEKHPERFGGHPSLPRLSAKIGILG